MANHFCETVVGFTSQKKNERYERKIKRCNGYNDRRKEKIQKEEMQKIKGIKERCQQINAPTNFFGFEKTGSQALFCVEASELREFNTQLMKLC